MSEQIHPLPEHLKTDRKLKVGPFTDPKARAPRHHTGPRVAKRNVITYHVSGKRTLSNLALTFLYPWTSRDYPGLSRGCMMLFGHTVSLSSIRNWRDGDRPAPSWAVERMLEAVEARNADGQAIIAALRAELPQARAREADLAARRSTIYTERGRSSQAAARARRKAAEAAAIPAIPEDPK